METAESSRSDAPVELVAIDIQMVRDLLDLLREKDVHSFQGFDLTVVFNEKSEFAGLPAKIQESIIEEDDGHSTSGKRVGGFQDRALWKGTNQHGKMLTFRGLE